MDCKEDCKCQQCYSKRYYLKNKDKILKYQKEYYYENSSPKKRRTPKDQLKFKFNNKKIFVIEFK